MKKLFFVTAVVFASINTPTLAADVGVSISIGQPGFYGQLDIGDFPQPQVIYRQPRVIERGVSVQRPPIYMHVPPGHAKNWRKHCHKYNACGERVYFVQDSWYSHQYVPHYQKRNHGRHGDGGDERGGDHSGNKRNDH